MICQAVVIRLFSDSGDRRAHSPQIARRRLGNFWTIESNT